MHLHFFSPAWLLNALACVFILSSSFCDYVSLSPVTVLFLPRLVWGFMEFVCFVENIIFAASIHSIPDDTVLDDIGCGWVLRGLLLKNVMKTWRDCQKSKETSPSKGVYRLERNELLHLTEGHISEESRAPQVTLWGLFLWILRRERVVSKCHSLGCYFDCYVKLYDHFSTLTIPFP